MKTIEKIETAKVTILGNGNPAYSSGSYGRTQDGQWLAWELKNQGYDTTPGSWMEEGTMGMEIRVGKREVPTIFNAVECSSEDHARAVAKRWDKSAAIADNAPDGGLVVYSESEL